MPDRQTCESQEGVERGYRWVNSQITFDNVLEAYLALFQVVSLQL